MPFSIVRNDITKMNVDVIVNAANTELQAGGGVCCAIFSAAGVDRLQKACNKLAPISTGEAVITKGFALPAKYVIHVAGPVYRDGTQNEEALLRSCYKNALDLAKKRKCKSLAFPLISSGIYGYPKDEALAAATSAISEWLLADDSSHSLDVSLVVFDKAAFAISQKLLGDIKAFVNEKYVDEQHRLFSRERSLRWSESELFAGETETAHEANAFQRAEDAFQMGELPEIPMQALKPAAAKPAAAKPAGVKPSKPDDIIAKLDEPFSVSLFRLIDAKGKTDIEVYKRANLDRKLFSKIRTGKGYMPSKKTVVALAVSLELSLPETRNLLERAGYALSRSVVFDVIIEYFITCRKYDIFEINNVLFEYDQTLLGG